MTKSQQRLALLEKEVKGRGVRLGYERLEYAGLRLKSGMCWFRGTYYLFVDRLKSVPERLDLLQSALDELDDLASQGRLDSPLVAESREVLEAGSPEAEGDSRKPSANQDQAAPTNNEAEAGAADHEPA